MHGNTRYIQHEASAMMACVPQARRKLINMKHETFIDNCLTILCTREPHPALIANS